MLASIQNTAADFTVTESRTPLAPHTYKFRLDDVVQLLTLDSTEIANLWPLDKDATREEIVEWLATNDRDGCYRDEDCEAEGMHPSDRDGSLWQVFAVYDQDAISAIFTLILIEWGVDLSEVARINRTAGDTSSCLYAQCCASDDFCDANQAMLDAIEIYCNLHGASGACPLDYEKQHHVFVPQWNLARFFWAANY